MVALLKRQFELLALQTKMRVENGLQHVEFKLEYYGGQHESELDVWTNEASLLQPSSDPQVPSHLVAVARRVAKTIADFSVPANVPLWLHLSKPYGWLGSLAWEAALEHQLARPVLRLPDFLERSRDNPGALDVAVCSDLPDGPSTVDQLDRVIQAILAGSPRRHTQVLVFALPENSRALRKSFRSESRVWIAPPPSPSADVEISPWLAAMTGALRERAVDAVHFVCRGAVVAGWASLRLVDPTQKGSSLAAARFPSTGEIATVLTRLGAWAAIFTLPRGEPDTDLRWFADALAQARPGAVLYDGGADLVPFYQFLFAPAPTEPPPLGPNFLYCQPAIATTFVDPGLARIVALGQNAHLFLTLASNLSQNPVLRSAAFLTSKVVSAIPAIAEVLGLRAPVAPKSTDATPTWVAAAQRYVEAASLDLLRRRSPDALLADRIRTVVEQESESDPPTPEQAKASLVVDQTLSELQAIIARHAQKAE